MKKKYIGIIIGVIIVVLGIIVISLNGKTIDYKDRSVDDWYNDIMNEKDVLTIFGASYCSHCQEYYPVITKLAKKYDLNLYFFEVDVLRKENKEDYDKLMTSFEIQGYEGDVPFTFIMQGGDYKNYSVGFVSRDYTVNFLKENGLIKD
jgi:thiol-disulfide isomerase/thioredoxin